MRKHRQTSKYLSDLPEVTVSQYLKYGHSPALLLSTPWVLLAHSA